MLILRRKIIAAVAVALVATGSACADLMPVCHSGAGSGEVPCTSSETERPETGEASLFGVGPATVALDTGWSGTWPEASEAACETQPGLGLTDRGSLDFCLYGLLGLGLCRSGHWVRRSGLGAVPEWYHSGGPFQVGHSIAVSPDSFCPAQVCFLQPDGEIDEQISHHRTGMVVSLWRCSQFTPSVLASRAPPRLS